MDWRKECSGMKPVGIRREIYNGIYSIQALDNCMES